MSDDHAAIAQRFLAGTRSLDEYLSYFSEDCVYKVANQPSVSGLEALGQAAGHFRSLVKGVKHEILSLHAFDDRVVCELIAHYTRNDGQEVSVPCLDLFTFSGGKIKTLQIFVDLSPVFRPS